MLGHVGQSQNCNNDMMMQTVVIRSDFPGAV